MTLIVCNKDGIYADKSVLVGHSELMVRGCKLRMHTSTRPNCCIGISGALHTNKGWFSYMADLLTPASIFLHQVEAYADKDMFRDLLDALEGACRAALYLTVSNMGQIEHPLLVMITRYHNLILHDPRNWPEWAMQGPSAFMAPDTFASVGSSAKAAYMFNALDETVPEIYRLCAQTDDMMSSDYDFVPRQSLYPTVDVFTMTEALKLLTEGVFTEPGVEPDAFMKHNKPLDLIKGFYVLAVFAGVYSTRERFHKQTKKPLAFRKEDIEFALAFTLLKWKEVRNMGKNELLASVNEFIDTVLSEKKA